MIIDLETDLDVSPCFREKLCIIHEDDARRFVFTLIML
jgi:hypothetical protein